MPLHWLLIINYPRNLTETPSLCAVRRQFGVFASVRDDDPLQDSLSPNKPHLLLDLVSQGAAAAAPDRAAALISYEIVLKWDISVVDIEQIAAFLTTLQAVCERAGLDEEGEVSAEQSEVSGTDDLSSDDYVNSDAEGEQDESYLLLRNHVKQFDDDFLECYETINHNHMTCE